MKDGLRILVVTVAALAYWLAVNAATGRTDPWDAPGYLTLYYPLSVGLAAIFGALFEARAWRWGAIMIFAQFPVVLVQGGLGPLFVVGLMLLGVLSIPAIIAAKGAAQVRRQFARP